MLTIPEWFSKPEWVRDFGEMQIAIRDATARRMKANKRRALLRSMWRRARAGR